jgi:hypothetical protein
MGYVQMSSKQISSNLVSYRKNQRLPGWPALTLRSPHGNARLAQRA